MKDHNKTVPQAFSVDTAYIKDLGLLCDAVQNKMHEGIVPCKQQRAMREIKRVKTNEVRLLIRQISLSSKG